MPHRDGGRSDQKAPTAADLVFDFYGVDHVDLDGLSLLLTARQDSFRLLPLMIGPRQ